MMTSVIGKRAFTLIELLLVVIILSVLVGVSLPTFKKTFDSLELNSSSRQLQAFMNYLHERSIVEGQVIYLYFDHQARQFWAETANNKNRLKSYHFSEAIKIDSPNGKIGFYPDGSMDDIALKITNRSKQTVGLFTKGVFGGVKLQMQQ